MYSRINRVPTHSVLLLGPRGTGKSTWLRASLPGAVWFDLLDAQVYLELSAAPHLLERRIPRGHAGWVVIDEVQRVPELLNEAHRLIEARGLRFALTGSSARKLRRGGVNLLAGRALSMRMHPLVAAELDGTLGMREAPRGGIDVVLRVPIGRRARLLL